MPPQIKKLVTKSGRDFCVAENTCFLRLPARNFSGTPYLVCKAGMVCRSGPQRPSRRLPCCPSGTLASPHSVRSVQELATGHSPKQPSVRPAAPMPRRVRLAFATALPSALLRLRVPGPLNPRVQQFLRALQFMPPSRTQILPGTVYIEGQHPHTGRRPLRRNLLRRETARNSRRIFLEQPLLGIRRLGVHSSRPLPPPMRTPMAPARCARRRRSPLRRRSFRFGCSRCHRCPSIL